MALAAWCLLTEGVRQPAAQAQVSSGRSYSDYFLDRTSAPYFQPSVSPRRTVYDLYFRDRPTLSPYLNLVYPRRGPYSAGLPNYFTTVQPELERRRAQQIRQETGRHIPTTAAQQWKPTRTTSSPTGYYSHYYDFSRR